MLMLLFVKVRLFSLFYKIPVRENSAGIFCREVISYFAEEIASVNASVKNGLEQIFYRGLNAQGFFQLCDIGHILFCALGFSHGSD